MQGETRGKSSWRERKGNRAIERKREEGREREREMERRERE